MSEPVPIHKNKSLADLPGEEWRDIPGFEGSFQASTLGRVRSLDRVIAHPRMGRQFVRGQIMSQSVALNRNIKTGEPMADLRVTITMEGVPYHFNTRRIVYLTFVDPHLDYDKDGLYVINIDGNGYDNRPDNLAVATKIEKQLRAVRRDRVMPTLKTADRSGWRKNYPRSRPIEQYDLHGNLVAEFPSVRAASRQTRIEDKAIIQVAKGLYRQWNGLSLGTGTAAPSRANRKNPAKVLGSRIPALSSRKELRHKPALPFAHKSIYSVPPCGPRPRLVHSFLFPFLFFWN